MTAEETRRSNIEAMGEQVGSLYSQLWQEVAWLHQTWAEYVVLFGTKESRVNLLNSVAPAFTRIVQDSLFEATILHIARLTDPPKSMGKSNLSVRTLEEVVSGEVLKERVSASVKEALDASDFCRDWRNRHLAHRDLQLALKIGGEPLQPASRLNVKEALGALAEVLNVLSRHYLNCTTIFELDGRIGGEPGGAMSLLYYIDMGVAAAKLRIEQWKSGNFDPDYHLPRDL